MLNYHYLDLISDLKSAVFPEVLNPVNKFSRNSFFFKLLTNINIQSNSKITIISNYPAGISSNVISTSFISNLIFFSSTIISKNFCFSKILI